MPRALITGVTGQDGSYLAELLLEKGYEVHGIIRPGQDSKGVYAAHLARITLHEADITDASAAERIVETVRPDECYHLASIVEPRILFEEELDILTVNFWSARHFLHAVKKIVSKCRFYLAGSSMMFGIPQSSPQSEATPMEPVTPYGIAKVAAYHLARMYRVSYGMHASTGILFNHESPRRAFHFLPRKITSAAAKIKAGLEQELVLGNIEAKRDWGFAGDFAESMWRMTQAEKADDYVIGTGELHTVKDILEIAFGALDLDWQKYVRVDEKLFRPLEAYNVVADISKAKKNLGWQPKLSFRELILMMVEEDKRLSGI